MREREITKPKDRTALCTLSFSAPSPSPSLPPSLKHCHGAKNIPAATEPLSPPLSLSLCLPSPIDANV